MSGYAVEVRTCECGRDFRVATWSKATRCLPCERQAAADTPLAKLVDALGKLDAHVGVWRYHVANPINAATVAPIVGLPEDDPLVADIVHAINARPADPFQGLENPNLRYTGRFYGQDVRLA